MADGIKVEIAEQIWLEWVAKFSAFSKKDMREGLYEEWPLLLRKVMDFTPPFKVKGSPGASDLSVGRAAVAFDIYKTMRPFNPAARTKGLERVLDRADVEAYNVIASRSKRPEMQGTQAIHFDPNEHLRQRDWRGRVNGRDRKRVVIGPEVGKLKGYVAQEQQAVGFAKSGWLKALLLAGGEAPGYVLKQGTGGGDVIDDHANENDPSITAINRTPWARRKDEGERILGEAAYSRVKSIISKIQTAIRLADKKAKG